VVQGRRANAQRKRDTDAKRKLNNSQVQPKASAWEYTQDKQERDMQTRKANMTCKTQCKSDVRTPNANATLECEVQEQSASAKCNTQYASNITASARAQSLKAKVQMQTPMAQSKDTQNQARSRKCRSRSVLVNASAKAHDYKRKPAHLHSCQTKVELD
jgi:hypothetical protein